jgi:hypothetical protein
MLHREMPLFVQRSTQNNKIHCVGIFENSALPGYYAASSGSFITDISVQSIVQEFLTVEDGTR